MIKWLTGAHRKSRQWVTDDPLATIATQRPSQVYAVTRVNPIFVEEEGRKSVAVVCSGAGQSGSSGYESQRSGGSSGGSGVLEDNLEQHPAYVKSILVAVRGAPLLSTIPEGRIDYCIPRPIWPRYEDRQRKPPVVRTDGHRRTRGKAMRRPRERTMEATSPYDLLQELSNTINHAVDSSDRDIPAEDILRDLGEKINKGLDALASQNLSPKLHDSGRYRGEKQVTTNKISCEQLSSEQALRRLSASLSRSEAVATVSRAFSHSGSSGGSSDSDLEAGHLSLLRRLGRFPPPDPLYDHTQGSTSSSSSGFSDLTPSPPSSSSCRPFGPVFLHENPTSVPTRVRNAMIYESLQCRVPGGYEKLRADQKVEVDKQWAVTEKGDVSESAEKDICVYPGLHSPDFTLDGHQAERLMRQLKASKRQRCWCRVVTTAFGLIFFLCSVMVVSMMLTRGKRMFGSL